MRAGRLAWNTAAMAVLCLVALVPLSSAYGSAEFWIAAGGGVLVGSAVAVLAARLRWGALRVAIALGFAYFALGGALVLRSESLWGAIPTPSVLASLARGAVQVWKQALTLQTPFVGFVELGAVPWMAGLVCSAAAVSLALRVRRFGFALIPVALLFGFSMVYSVFEPLVPALTAAGLAGVALAWASWRSRLARRAAARATAWDPSTADDRLGLRGLPLAAGAIAVAVLAGALGAAAPLQDRWVLRDHVVPPLELHDYASPLTSFRKWVTDGEDAELFTVAGLPEGARIRLAGLDLYDGIVYQVSGGGAGSGRFIRVGREIEHDAAVPGSRRADVEVEVGELAGIWMPSAGQLTSLHLQDDRRSRRGGDLHYNSATGTAVITSGLRPGDRYGFEALVPETPDEQRVARARIADVEMPKPEQVPEALVTALDEMIEGATTPEQQVRAVETWFASNGFFSHGLSGEVASRSGHGVGRVADLFTGNQMVGDDEQYSVAMSLALAQLGIPSRVALGFSGDGGTGFEGGSLTVTGEQAHAWVEVPFEGLGWVAFWPTPPEDQTPLEEVPEQRQKPRAQVAQPPETPQEPAELPPAPPSEDLDDDADEEGLDWLWLALRIGGLSLLALAILLGPTVALAVLKARLRSRRAADPIPANRLHGGWAELLDTAVDVREPVPPRATRRAQGAVLDERFPDAGIALLAARADAAVFGAGDPDDDEVSRYWADVAAARASMRRAVPLRRRIAARMFPSSAIRRLRLRRGRGRRR